ncbi:hypothetical protein CNR22_19530 [Sphingobacteriaceae bacterium]|nr:hypothetical protein CNR22_19530 [Sphingobacteriaceae bacterium]
MKFIFPFLIVLMALICCTKDQGKNPSLAYTDYALLDSCKQNRHYYYKDDATTLLSGAHGPHGTFKLRFNTIAYRALTDKGTLPVGNVFPDGSLIIKDIYSGGALNLYALMYKRSGTWLWAEIEPGGNIHHSINSAESICTGCHSQSGNRDLAVSFNFY